MKNFLSIKNIFLFVTFLFAISLITNIVVIGKYNILLFLNKQERLNAEEALASKVSVEKALHFAKTDIENLQNENKILSNQLQNKIAFIKSSEFHANKTDYKTKYLKTVNSSQKKEQNLANTIESLNKSNQALIAENHVLQVQSASLLSQNIATSNKIETTNNLILSNIQIKSFRLLKNGLETEDINAKSVQRIKVEFNIEANPFIEANTKRVHLVLRNNSGMIVSSAHTCLLTDMNGKKQSCTYHSDIEYSNEVKKVFLSFDTGKIFSKGMYWIDIYVDKKYIDQTSFHLK